MTIAADPASVYADAARLKKIIFLTGSIDAALGMLGCDAFGAAALEYVTALSEEGWRIAARHANVNLPSQTTRDAIVDLYRRRIEVRACLDRVVKSAGSR